MTTFTRRTLRQGRHRAGRGRRARRPGLARMGEGLGAEPRPGSRRKARSSRCCAGSTSCSPRTTPSWRCVDAFTKATGVKVNVTRESLDDVQPKASVAANTGPGPDMFWGLYSLPHLFPQKCVDVTDVADYLGKKYGGWVPTRGHLRQERQQVDRHPGLLQRQRASTTA